MEDTGTVNKRRRTASNDYISINDIPDAFLSHVAIYLSKPQQALFAIALYTHHQTPSDSNNSSTSEEWMPNATSNAITSTTSREQWQVLDFGDVEKSLASKLSDDHVRAILRCIDAPNNLKTLKLAGCVNITGSCFDILRDTSLENIDISLVGMHESPRINQAPQLSENIMIPFLDSVMGSGSLKLLQLPWKWKFRNEPTIEMEQFLRRYEQYLEAFRYKCSKCNALCEATGAQWMYIDDDMRGLDFFGMQNYTCYQCLNYYCYDEDCRDDYGYCQLRGCARCAKVYCKNCVPHPQWKGCGNCGGEEFCSGCIKTMKECEGEDCTKQLCEKCKNQRICSYCDQTRCPSCASSYQCSRSECAKVICKECVESKGEGGGGKCNSCRKAFCSAECQFMEGLSCNSCAKATASYFRSKCQELKKESS